MKKIIPLLLALAGAAHADPRVDHMVAQCESVMQTGACRVALDPKDYPNSTILIGGVGRISTESYLRIRGLGESRNADGTYKMCEIIRIVCPTADTDTEDCRAVRFLWRQR